jgi:RHH-type proline utilization regulon transcriptional repressor/proline dehydrogenase/delta 1-pyrroline-5-carboxylate dehydrogenase
MDSPSHQEPPFQAFDPGIPPRAPMRARITEATRRPEPDCLPPLIAAATLSDAERTQAAALARQLVLALRAKAGRGLVEALMQEYALSSQEGIALMCLAEALLRIPDPATRDALIRDKIAGGDWQRHLGHSRSLFVNAATWGLLVTGRLTATSSEAGLTAALTRLLGRGGEPVIRRGVDFAMRLLGEQFVAGETIAAALAHGRKLEAKGFRYSYDMLGEAAVTAADAQRYFQDYEHAVDAIGREAAGRPLHEAPGISIKLSALHPRYSRAQRPRVMAELLPRLRALTALAHGHDIGLNIDAEETDRLDLSLDLLEALCRDPAFAGWHGIGFVVQAYQKRAPFVLDWLIDLARATGHRLMIRLVKGAYWDSEIKRAQVDGLEDYPVFTRKLHTDVSYLACARRLLEARAAVFPQFATHNAYTLAAVHAMAGADFTPGQYEFQCLHGMGEPLYEEVVGPARLDRPCRIYAPVGTHETLLAYLVRRLLENGANTSFVNRIADPEVPVEALIADPVAEAARLRPVGAPHPAILLPAQLPGEGRINSTGLDLADDAVLAELTASLAADNARLWSAAPGGAVPEAAAGSVAAPHRAPTHHPTQAGPRPCRNPADARDLVGMVTEATPADIATAIEAARSSAWPTTPQAARAAILRRAATMLEAHRPALLGLIVREAGKTLPNAVGELREAVDFLRYYAARIEVAADAPALGPVACISPWNFPLAIFTGQVAAALAAGNAVLAKPAEETPLIAAEAVRVLHAAGIPTDALQLLPGDGATGAALVADPAIAGVMFTGSTAVAKLIQRQLAGRLGPDGSPVPLIAETGGLNAMVVDSSALAEQVVADVIASAFDSAGQRCSALRVLCLQEEVADRVLAMLRGAMAELRIGPPDRLATDIGPVISAEAAARIRAHVAAARSVYSLPLPEACAPGHFVAPALIELAAPADVREEIFGPVLHVVRYRRDALPALLAQIKASGYGLTFGLHTRIDETIDSVTARVAAGNIYVNRNMIGAVVGVQPFGGHGLSGTGPKAGGPLYLERLRRRPARPAGLPPGVQPPAALAWRNWLDARGLSAAAAFCAQCLAETLAGVTLDLPGPVGERNVYRLVGRGRVLCLAPTRAGVLNLVSLALAAGNRALVLREESGGHAEVAASVADAVCDAVLYDGDDSGLIALAQAMAARDGTIVPVLRPAQALPMLVQERSVSTNTAASGGNPALMRIG